MINTEYADAEAYDIDIRIGFETPALGLNTSFNNVYINSLDHVGASLYKVIVKSMFVRRFLDWCLSVTMATASVICILN